VKTQILQLEPHDDVISTRDKMEWSQTGRVVLVWPNRGQVLTQRLDLVLLQRHSAKHGTQLALVTHDAEVRFHAGYLGIPVFDNLRQAQDMRWRRRQRHPPRIHLPERPNDEPILPHRIPQKPEVTSSFPVKDIPPAVRLVLFTLGVIAFLSLAAALLPTADLTLTPETKTQSITLTVTGSTAVDRVNISGLVPIRPTKVVVEGRQSITPTGTTLVPDHSSSGQALFTNLTDRLVTIPMGTVISTRDSTIRFVTEQVGQVPGGPGQSRILAIRAINPGSGYNLAPGRLQAIQGSLGTKLSVTNPNPTTGGTDHTNPAPSSLDRSLLYDQLYSSLQKSALSEIQTSLQPSDLLLTSSPVLDHTVEETFDPPDDQPANQLTLTLRLQFQALMVSGNDLQDLAESTLDANIPNSYSSRPESLVIEHLTDPEFQDETTVQWMLRASREIQAQFPKTQAANLCIGLSPNRARQRLLERLPITGTPDINVFPSWWPRLPIIPFRIHVSTIPVNG
jgi:hypothetical protein